MFTLCYHSGTRAYYYDPEEMDWGDYRAELFETEEEAKEALKFFILITILSDKEETQEWDETIFEVVNLDSSPSKRFKLDLKDPLIPLD
uniref:Uncharacterized protein n=1 Tax=Siphoviridae sp. ctZHD14 TaxID=2827891 RepID=A0A8S5SWG9_9CAUD|nr:MAG TPA: hypothetical protein [Siphoviridae sp. ctZHD14]